MSTLLIIVIAYSMIYVSLRAYCWYQCGAPWDSDDRLSIQVLQTIEAFVPFLLELYGIRYFIMGYLLPKFNRR